MQDYNYEEAMYEDVKDGVFEWMKCNDVNLSDLSEGDDLMDFVDYQAIYDELYESFNFWYVSTYQAEEYLCHNTSLLWEACEEIDTTPRKDPMWNDNMIRCYLLSRVLTKVLSDLSDALEEALDEA